MKHRTTDRFWECYSNLPSAIQTLAEKNFSLLKVDPNHPSLQFKKIGKLWSVRVGLAHRALAVKDKDVFIWIWIGTHDEYERLIRGR